MASGVYEAAGGIALKLLTYSATLSFAEDAAKMTSLVFARTV
jgi:hypothetical protein